MNTALSANKALGQHFLTDGNIIANIVKAINPKPGQPLLEIGPGPGALTAALLATGAHVTVVEKDSRFIEPLSQLADQQPGTLTLHHADALKVDYTSLVPAGTPLVGNLPYNVGTEIIFKALATPQHFSKLTIMLQKEVIDRMVANPGNKNWGRLGVMCDLLTEPNKHFDVPPNAFSPPPKVLSSVITLTPRPQPKYPVDIKKLQQLLQCTFTQRRKMLRKSLQNVITTTALEELGIDPTARVETLNTQQLCELANLL